MTKEDLFRQLGLSDIHPPGDLPEGEDAGGIVVPADPHALKLDDWGKRQGEEILSSNESFQELFQDQKEEERTQQTVADLFGLCFEPDPRLTEKCEDVRRGEFVRALYESPDYHALHKRTQLDFVASEMAAFSFACQLAELTRKDPPGEKGKCSDTEIETIVAAGKALGEAEKELDTLDDIRDSMGGDGAIPGQKMDPSALKELVEKIKKSKRVRKILEWAGKFRRVARSQQFKKTHHGQDDMVGVELSGDISRLVAEETMKLVIPELKLDMLRRLVEGQCMSIDRREVEPVGKGPILITLDESGSMTGSKIETAKALALTMAWLARTQKRWCGLVGYAGGTAGNLLALPPGKWNEDALFLWLEHFYSGGTNRDIPIVELPEFYDSMGCPPGVTDLIMITDALCSLSEMQVNIFNAWKKEKKVTAYSFLIGQHTGGELEKISDRVYRVPEITPDSPEVLEVLSL